MVMEGNAPVAPPNVGGNNQDTKFTYRPPVRPYITSTPNDFNAERDFLMRTVFPVLDEVCKERGTYFSAVDLRWTAKDRYAKDGNVLELSLDKIAQSSPFFMCLLGECYGYHRPETAAPLPKTYDDLPDDCDWVDRNFMIADTGGYHWVLKDGRQLCSLTEIEIIEAAFFTDDEYCFFYFRQADHVDDLYLDLPKVEREEKLQVFQSESEYANLKIRDLKSRIVKKGLSVKYFRTLEDLANVVSEDWMEVINTLYPPLPRALIDRDTEEFHEIISNEAFAQSRTQNFVCTPEMDDVMAELTHFASTAHNDHAINEELENILNLSKFSYAKKMRKDKPIEIKYKSLLVLAGPRGYGKSAMVVNWLNDFIDEYPDIKVISMLVGSSLASFDIAAFMRRATRELKREFMPEFTDEDLQRTWQADDLENFSLTCETLMAAASLGPCVLVIDGVDELCSTCGLTQKQIKEMDWLPLPLPPQVKVIMTTSSTDLSFKSLSKRRDADIITLPLFKERPQRLKLAQEFMMNMNSKHLPKRAFKAILDCKHANRPMYLHALAGEFRLYQVYTLIDHYLETYLDISSLRDLWAKIIQRWIAEYSWTSEPKPNTEMAPTLTQQPDFEYTGWIADALRLLAVSRQGLTEVEIRACLRQIGYYGDSAITSLDWAIFRNAAFGMLIERPGGLLNYFHYHCKEAVEYALLGTVIPTGDATTKQSVTNSWNLDKQKYHGYLAAFFLAQPHSTRRTDELPYHMEHNGDMGGLCSVVTDPQIFLCMYAESGSSSRQLDLLHYWRLLQQFGYSAADVYIELVEGREPATDDEEMQDTVTSDDVSKLGGATGQDLPTIIMTHASSRDLFVIEEGGSVEGSNIKSSDHGSDHPGSDDVSVQEEGQTFLTDNQEEADHARGPPRQRAYLAYNVGLFLSQLGHGDEAVGMLLNAHSCLNDNYPLDFDSSSLHCEVQEALGNLFAKYENQDAAIYWLKKALNTISDILISSEIDDQLDKVMERKGHIMDKLGYLCLASARLYEADDLLTGALECMEEVGSVTGRASVHHHIGQLKLHQQEYLKAEGSYRYALMMLEQWYGKKHTMVSKVLQDLAALLCMKENTQGFNRDEAEALFRRALAIRERSLGDGHVLVAETLASLGELMNRSGSLSAKSEAKLLLQRALDVKTTKLGPNHPSTRLVRKELNDTGITLKLGLYDYGPAKPTDKRTMDFPCSSMSWRENDLSSLLEGGRSKSRLSKYSKSPGPSGTPSGMWGTSKYRMETPTEPTAKSAPDDDAFGEEIETVSDKVKASTRGSQSGKDSQMSNRSYSEDLMKLSDSKKKLGRPASSGDRQSPRSSEKQRLFRRDAFDVRLRYPDPEDDLSINTARLSIPRSLTPSSRKVALGVAPMINVKPPNMVNSDNSDMPHYVESYADQFQTQESGKLSRRNRIEQSKLRPKSAPVSSYAEYFTGAPVKVIPRTFINPTPMRTRSMSARVNSAHSLCSSHGTYKSFESAAIHGTHCRIPGAHTIHPSNAITIQGPHSSIKSLMGPPACPRDASLKVRHYSTWFQVPGRYPTVSNPYPPKRSQLVKRVVTTKRGGSAPSGGMNGNETQLQSKSELSVTFKEEAARPATSQC